MTYSCPRCGATAQTCDRFCARCGAELDGETQDQFAALPGLPESPDPGPRRTGRWYQPWYRRKLVLIPLVVLVSLGVLAGGVWVYIDSKFDTINSLSTVPPQVNGAQLGGDPDVVVDTGPAQEAVRRRQREAEAEPSSSAAGGSAREAATGRNDFVGSGWTGGSHSRQGATPPADGTPETIQLPVVDTDEPILVLLMGVDARPGEAIDVGVRSDTLAVLNLDPATGDCRILAIPRDSRVELPGYGASKVNHALAVGGVPYQMLVVEDLLGIRFDHYGLVDFAGAEGIVDELGGITVENERSFANGGYQFPVGKLRLNGEETLAYARYRGGAEGDFGRQERQQDIVRAMLAEGADLDVVTAIPQLLDALEGHVRTDAGPSRLIDLGQEFHSTCTAETLDARRMDGKVTTLPDAIFNEPLSFVVLEEAEVREQRTWLLTGSDEPPATPAPAPASPVATPAMAEPTRPRSTPAATEPVR